MPGDAEVLIEVRAVAVENVDPLSDVESAWRRTDLRGKRLVVLP